MFSASACIHFVGDVEMKDLVMIPRSVPQYKGCVHMHTNRSPDSKCPYPDALVEYRSKGFHFCVMTDHEIYWNSEECDQKDFLVLAGVERAFLPNEDHPVLLSKNLQKHCHMNLIWDVTAGPCGYRHNEVLPRPVDWGISSWNRYIREFRDHNQLVIYNHPDWAHTDFNTLLAVEGCFAFEVWNTGSVKDVGGHTDDAVWDYCLERGKRIWAVAGDDTHHYGADFNICGVSATVVYTNDFSRAGIVTALKQGCFYPTTGPEIHEMRIENGRLLMEFSQASLVQICGGDRWGYSTYAKDEPLTKLDWPIRDGLNYFRVKIFDHQGNMAWSQPVFMEDLMEQE